MQHVATFADLDVATFANVDEATFANVDEATGDNLDVATHALTWMNRPTNRQTEYWGH